MTSKKYQGAEFPSDCSTQITVLQLSVSVLKDFNNYSEEIFSFADDSHVHHPRMVSEEIIQRIESDLNFFASIDITSSASTSKSSSPLPEDSSSVCHSQNEPVQEESSVPQNLETKSTSSDSEESDMRVRQKLNLFPTNLELMTLDMPKEKVTRRSTQNLRNLIKSSINLLSITATDDDPLKIEVELNMDYFMSEGNSPIKSEQDPDPIIVHESISPSKRKGRLAASSPLKRIKSEHGPSIASEDAGPIIVQQTISPVKPERKSPESSSSKSKKSEPGPSIASEPLPSVDYSDPIELRLRILQLLRVTTRNEDRMDHIQEFFNEFASKLGYWDRSLTLMILVLELVPETAEHKLANEYNELCGDLRSKIHKVGKEMRKLKKELEEEAKVFKDFSNESVPLRNEVIARLYLPPPDNLTYSDLKRIGVEMKDKSERAFGMEIPYERRRNTLLKLSKDFDWLVPEFIKFNIIHRILRPSQVPSLITLDT